MVANFISVARRVDSKLEKNVDSSGVENRCWLVVVSLDANEIVLGLKSLRNDACARQRTSMVGSVLL
jgi:hypothetical protein